MTKKAENYVRTMASGEERMFVATFGDQIIGFASVAVNGIRAVYVSPDHVRKGIGSQLLGVLEEHAASSQAGVIRLYSSLQAEAFYIKAGYRWLSAVKYPLVGGNFLEAIEMEKQIFGSSGPK
jgi:GNAT superfamily N-acetyltransferase